MAHGATRPDEVPARLLQLALADIEPNPRQPRRQFSEAQLLELARSIASQGVIQPLLVRPHPEVAGRYQLVAGERRLRAIRQLGWAEVPALVRNVPDDALLEAALVENLQREQLTPSEEALAYRTLLDQYGYTQEALSLRLGKDRSTIANMVRLLTLPPRLLEDLDAARLTTGHARALLGLPGAERQLALREIVLARSLSVRETERLVQRERAGAAPAHGAAQAEPAPTLPSAEALQFQAVQEMLERRFATRVSIRQTGGGTDSAGGRIEIEYYSLDDFNRLYELLVR